MMKVTLQILSAGLIGLTGWTLFLTSAQAATFSLAGDFSYKENYANSTWSFRLDDGADNRPTFPMLPLPDRNANDVWGSNFPTPPMMWNEDSGYWGIGKNLTGEEQFSSHNDLHWAPNEVLLHPKGGATPSGLVVGWTAPDDMLVNVAYSFALASPHSSGVGLRILKRGRGVDTEIVVLNNIGNGICNELNEVSVSQGDQLFFRFNTAGEATGDIVRVAITVNEMSAPPPVPRLAGATITAGSDFTFTAPSHDEESYQWFKDGQLLEGATNASLRIPHVDMAKAGSYTVHSGAASSNIAMLNVTPESVRPTPYTSPVPRQRFSETLAKQEEELKTNALMLRFAASRQSLATDRYRPAYHFVSPENMLNDPNGLCFWQGHWHLFYQAYPPDEFPNPQDIKRRRQHWGHAVSADLVHWRDLPYAIYPDIERMCFSGSTVVEADRVVAFYPGIGAGQMVAIADDPLLLNWDKIGPVNSGHGDSDIWTEQGKYYGLVGRSLWVSDDLEHWESRGEFLTSTPFIGNDDDGACPNFEPIGDKHILLFFSHTNGGQYFLGDYADQRFTPYAHGRLNHGRVAPGGVHAPSAASDGNGGVFSILNINDARPSDDWDQIMSVPQHLTLGIDKRLRIEPIEALASLRGDHQHVGRQVLAANQEIVLDQIQGNTLELAVEIDPQLSRWVQLTVLRSPNAEEQTLITFFNFDRQVTYWYHPAGELVLDGTRSSTLPDVWFRPPERAVMKRDGELLKLRVFIDRSVVEVFANGRQYLAMRVYPGRLDSLGVSIRAQGQDAVLNSLDAWQLQSVWP